MALGARLSGYTWITARARGGSIDAGSLRVLAALATKPGEISGLK